jgi:phospholipase/lecithinase/hemolysin
VRRFARNCSPRGGNDLSACGPNCTPAQIQQVVTNLDILVNDLHDFGAKHFFVVNQYGAAKAANTDDISFNALLLQDMTSLLPSPEITVFDAAAVVKQMDTPGNQWGFTEGLGSPCYAGGSLAGAVGNGATMCSIPTNYVQWDSNGHLTASANQVSGDAMYGALPVPEPTSLCMLIIGVSTMCCRRRFRVP